MQLYRPETYTLNASYSVNKCVRDQSISILNTIKYTVTEYSGRGRENMHKKL